MRALLLILPLAALPACTTAPTAPAQVTPDVAVTIPMDPGTLQCALLSNSNARVAAADWAIGRARAAVLSGRTTTAPDEAAITNGLVRYCSANPNASVRDGAMQLGF